MADELPDDEGAPKPWCPTTNSDCEKNCDKVCALAPLGQDTPPTKNAAPDRCQFEGEIETHLGPVHRVGAVVACDRCKTAWIIAERS